MLGPLIQALWFIVLECLRFIVIFIIVVILFGFLAHISFHNNATGRFNTLFLAILFLVEAMFGQFAFADFDSDSPTFGPIFLIIYLFIVAIVFTNLLVAILTFTFETASKKSRLHFYME